MTTENTQPEKSDVDPSVAEQPHAPETDPTPGSHESAMPVEAQAHGEGETDQPGEHHIPQEEESSDESPIVQDMQSNEPTGLEEVFKPDTEPDTVITEYEPLAESSVPASSEVILQEEENIVRPFTDFIEEFRQAEGRTAFQFIVPEFIAPEPGFVALPEEEASALPLLQEEMLIPPVEEATEHMEDTADRPVSPETPVTEPSTSAVPEPPAPAERPVSPLLRPASRSRMPRHGRQREESPAAEVVQTESQQNGPQAEQEAEPAPPESAAPAPVEERPRPARRYRFDRPATVSSGSPSAASATQARVEESKDTTSRSSTTTAAHMETGHAPDTSVGEGQSKQAGAGTQSLEQKRPVVQEPTAAESPTPPVSQQERRRNRGQDRQREKEQVAPATEPAAPVAEVAAPTAETTVPEAAEIAPEDLPPLEYSELRAASSRRRRRRRTSVAPGTPAASTPPVPTPLAAKPVVPEPPSPPAVVPPVAVTPIAVPRNITMPATTVTPANQYNLISGYTVNQMNQGDGAGPFMGPEPSPARGSAVSREVRSMRPEVQRAPTYPSVRHSEHSGTSVGQFANVVVQAIQAQTDRMVAELRRANQAPANVSVSLPPLPSTERVGVFVDVANLLYSARTLRMTIDFGKLLDFLRGNRRLVRAHAYCPTSPQPGEDQMFLQAVKGLGYRITTKNYKTFSSGAKKADLDLDLCMDVVRLVEGKAVDCVVLVSGDSDFMPMLDYCSDHGVRVEVAAFDEAMSATLRQSCDLFINLSMLEEIRA